MKIGTFGEALQDAFNKKLMEEVAKQIDEEMLLHLQKITGKVKTSTSIDKLCKRNNYNFIRRK